MILVTGASGTVGSEVVKSLQQAGAPFRAGLYSQSSLEEAHSKRLDAVAIDFAKPETLRPALAGVDRVFLISGNVPNQTQLEINVLREAQRAGVGHIVKSSVWGADTESFAFAKIHRPVEREIEKSGLRYTLLRPNGYMQNMANFYSQSIREQGAFYLPVGDAKISHIDARDIGRVAAKVLTEDGHAGKAYELSGPEALTYTQIAERLSAVVGRKISYVNLTDEDFKKGALASGMPEAALEALLSLCHFYKTGAASRVTPAVREITGKESTAFEQYVKDYAAMFAQGASAAR